MVGARSRRAAGAGSYLAIGGFFVVYLVGAAFWPRPLWVAGVYLVATLVCFALYAIDKHSARSGRRRVSERTLLAWGLLGGWPGAIVAQQTLRHKTSKQSFRRRFRATVFINITLFIALSSPAFDRVLG